MSNNEQFEDITNNSNKVVVAAKLDVGGNFQGKLLDITTNRKYENNKDLVMEDEQGKQFIVFTSGSLRYAIQDGKFEVGRTYRVTRLENKMVKGKSSSQFQIQRLREDGAVAAPTQNATQAPARR